MQSEISMTIPLERVTGRVEAEPVELQNQPITDQNVDTTDALDRNLGSQSDAPTPKPETRECLQPGLTARIRLVQKPPIHEWQRRERLFELRAPSQS